MVHDNHGLKRSLQPRHIRLMALGSTIGVGLFLGSATAIQLAGPSIILGYILAGLVAFIVLRALGEMAVHEPVAGSFAPPSWRILLLEFFGQQHLDRAAVQQRPGPLFWRRRVK